MAENRWLSWQSCKEVRKKKKSLHQDNLTQFCFPHPGWTSGLSQAKIQKSREVWDHIMLGFQVLGKFPLHGSGIRPWENCFWRSSVTWGSQQQITCSPSVFVDKDCVCVFNKPFFCHLVVESQKKQNLKDLTFFQAMRIMGPHDSHTFLDHANDPSGKKELIVSSHILSPLSHSKELLIAKVRPK